MFSNRLKEFIDSIGSSPSSFEPIIGVAKGTIYKPIKNGKTVGIEILEKIFSKYPNLNLEWLIAGKGEMFKSSTILSENNDDVHLLSTPNCTPNSKSEDLGVQLSDVDLNCRPNSRPISKSEDLGLQKESILSEEYQKIELLYKLLRETELVVNTKNEVISSQKETLKSYQDTIKSLNRVIEALEDKVNFTERHTVKTGSVTTQNT